MNLIKGKRLTDRELMKFKELEILNTEQRVQEYIDKLELDIFEYCGVNKKYLNDEIYISSAYNNQL